MIMHSIDQDHFQFGIGTAGLEAQNCWNIYAGLEDQFGLGTAGPEAQNCWNVDAELEGQFELGNAGLEGQNCGSLDGFYGDWGKGSMPILQSLVLDDEDGEALASCGGIGKKGGASGTKTAAALKSHREAERRRRERINTRLATLRALVPSKEKMEKAALLAEVVRYVKQLKKTAAEASEGLFIPTDSDEVLVEQIYDSTGDGTFYFKASLCCEYRPELLPELKKTISALPVSLVKAEISTLGSRMKYEFQFRSIREGLGNDDAEGRKLLMSSVQKSLRSILDKISLVLEYSPRTTPPNKRKRFSCIDSSSSSL